MSAAKIDKLVRMANQIGDFFAPMGEDAATIGVATHLKRFWTPKMISEMIDLAGFGSGGTESSGGAGCRRAEARSASRRRGQGLTLGLVEKSK